MVSGIFLFPLSYLIWSAYVAVVAVIICAIAAAFVTMTFIYFTHPDDSEESLLPKIIVIFSLWLASVNVLCLTLDIFNTRMDGGLAMEYLWQAINIMIAILVGLIIPFGFFYYEADDEGDEVGSSGMKLQNSIKSTAAFLFVFLMLLMLMYSYANQTDIPIILHNIDSTKSGLIFEVGTSFSGSTSSVGSYNSAFDDTVSGLVWSKFFWTFPVTFVVYLLAILSFVGNFFFSIFGGIGLMALPVELINDFLTRPTPMKPDEYAKKKLDVGNRAAKLLEIGKSLLNDVELAGNPKQGANKRQIKLNKRTENSFEQAVYLLKRENNILFVAHKLKGGNPLWYFGMLALGLMAFGLSFSWLIHIMVFVLPEQPINPWLNNFFIAMEDGIRILPLIFYFYISADFPLFGLITFAIYCFYLVWATMKGAFRFGMRIPYLFKIYPMEVGNTYLNAFLANSWLVVLTSVPIVQFCTTSLPYYTRSTSVDLLLGSQVKYLLYLRYFFAFNAFNYLLIISAGLAFFHLLSNPNDHSANIEAELKNMANADDDDLGVD